jgi:hypothetical protein
MAMDELELLKKDWQQKEGQLPQLSFEDIYSMLRKKSSSIVRWIFYISIIEFVFWIIINRITLGDDESTIPEAAFSNTLLLSLEIAGYAILAYFIFLFYKNYKKITATDSAKDLMKNIIKTRKTVMNYVWINLALFAVSMILVFIQVVFFNPNFSKLTEQVADSSSPLLMWILIFLALLVTIALVVGILWLFYRLLYGILLKRLRLNYKELKNLEI